jgi:hypothetical protein
MKAALGEFRNFKVAENKNNKRDLRDFWWNYPISL